MAALEESPTTPSSSLRLSVLDQSPVSEGSTGAQALHNTLDLARLADELGYHRYWVAEHHGTPMLASASPEVLIGPIASATERIRVGSGGVMLPHYSPRKVAESFSMLSGLYGDRIDLGLGRAAGTDPMTTHALQRDRRVPAPDDFPQQLAELLAYLEERPPPDRRFAGLAPLPAAPAAPEPWLLGSSLQSAIWAGQLGLSYAFADFINPGKGEIAQFYRESFEHGQRLPEPRVAVCVAAICAETDERAEELALSGRMSRSMMNRGRLIPVPPVETARRYFEAKGPSAAPVGRRAVIGSPGTVRAGLEEVAREYGADEVMVVTITYSHEARRRSYELIAEAFGQAPVESGRPALVEGATG